MSLEPGVIGFAAFACLALATPGRRARLSPGAFPDARTARVLGWLLLTVAAIVAMTREGPGFGLVAWIGQLSVAAALLVLLMSWRPAYVPAAGAFALACAPLAGL